MRGVVFLAAVLVAGSASGGQLIGGDPHPPQLITGQVNIRGDAWVRFPGSPYDGAWLFSIDLLGSAQSLDVISGKSGQVIATVSAAGPADENGWTRYDLRSLGLFESYDPSGFSWINGVVDSLFFGLRNGYFSKVRGYDIPNSPSNAELYLPNGTIENAGAMVIGGPVWEIPDPPYGDGNHDGRINLNDFGLLKANFGTFGRQPFTHGDLTGNGKVTLNDFDILKQNFGWVAPASAPVPEPLSVVLFMLGLANLGIARLR